MKSFTDGRCRSQISMLRRQFLQDDGLPFCDVLSAKTLSTALATIEGGWIDRIYTPVVTLWLFLGQVLNADHSCRAAVARLIAHRVARGQSPCSAETGAYCQARKRLPEEFFATAARDVGRKLEDQAKPEWLWKGHHVYLFDGTTTLMPDTVENRTAYPKETLADLYRRRWHNELDLRSIKTEMGMECLRCKTPALVCKEVWAHALAYNLIRTVMAQAATQSDSQPRAISFKGALQTLEAFRPAIALLGHTVSARTDLYRHLLDAIAQHRVGDRPDRFEPRRIKRRHKHYVPLSVPRHIAKLQILKGLAKN